MSNHDDLSQAFIPIEHRKDKLERVKLSGPKLFWPSGRCKNDQVVNRMLQIIDEVLRRRWPRAKINKQTVDIFYQQSISGAASRVAHDSLKLFIRILENIHCAQLVYGFPRDLEENLREECFATSPRTITKKCSF